MVCRTSVCMCVCVGRGIGSVESWGGRCVAAVVSRVCGAGTRVFVCECVLEGVCVSGTACGRFSRSVGGGGDGGRYDEGE